VQLWWKSVLKERTTTMRRTDNYASNQIRLLLGELSGSKHADKKKALKAFQTYIETYQPEVQVVIFFRNFLLEYFFLCEFVCCIDCG
jgi:hypothetical protein